MKKLIWLLTILFFLIAPGYAQEKAEQSNDDPVQDASLTFDGAWLPSLDPAEIGAKNFSTLENMRYRPNGGIEGVNGYSKINTQAISTYVKAKSGIHLKKTTPQPESHVLAQAYNSGETASRIYQNTASIPSQGNYSSEILHTDSADGGLGRWSKAPDGVAYCNGAECLTWSGDERKVQGFFLFTSDGLYGASHIDNVDFIDGNPDYLEATDGENFSTNGFAPGQRITISDAGSATSANLGSYTIVKIQDDGGGGTKNRMVLNTNDLVVESGTDDLAITIEPISGTDDLYERTEEVNNSLSDSTNVASVYNGLDSYTQLQIDFDGADGTTSLSDETGTHSPTVNGDAQLTTSNKKFGTASIDMDNSGDYVSISDNSDFDIISGDFTVEFWYRHENTQGYWKDPLFEHYEDNDNYYVLWYQHWEYSNPDIYDYIYFYVVSGGTGIVTIGVAETDCMDDPNVWYHVAVVKDGDDYQIYVDGESVLSGGAKDTDSDSDTFTGNFNIGYSEWLGAYANGQIDEFRLSSMARYDVDSSSITVPSAPFPDDETLNTWLVMSSRPLQGVRYYISTENADADVEMSGWYWSGEYFDELVNMVDGSGGLRFSGGSDSKLLGEQANLITNGETWTGATGATPPTGWTVEVDTAGTFTITADTGPGGTGDSCLKLEVNATPTAGPAIYDSFSTTSGSVYRLIFYGKGDGSDPDSQVLLGTTGGGSEIATVYDSTWGSSWEEKEYIFRATGATTYLTLMCDEGAAGRYIYFDNVEIREITPGLVSFESTEDTAQPMYFQGSSLYTYKFSIDTGDATIYQATGDAAFQPIVDVWDEVLVNPIVFKYSDNGAVTDYTIAVNTNTGSSTVFGAEIDSFSYTGDYIYVGFEERVCGLYFSMAEGSDNNDEHVRPRIKYYNGSGWNEVTLLNDDTSAEGDGGVFLGQTGTVTWAAPPKGIEQPFKDPSEGKVGYYYKIETSGADMSADVIIDTISGISVAGEQPTGFKFPAIFGNRLLLCGYEEGNDGNRIDVSLPTTQDVWNGAETSWNGIQSLYVGGSEPLTAGAQLYNRYGSNIFSMFLALKDNELYTITGSTPDTEDSDVFQILPVSSQIGCPAPLTLTIADISMEVLGGLTRQVAMWVSSSGPVMFDGTSLMPIQGLETYFDPESSDVITKSNLEDARAWYDGTYGEWNVVFPGDSLWFVYDVGVKKWFRKKPASKYPIAAWQVVDTNGVEYIYGAIDTGYTMRLENGNMWDSSDIIYTVETGDFFPTESLWYKTRLRNLKVVAKDITESGNLTLTHYADSASSGTSLTAFNLNSGSNRLVYNTQALNLLAWAHRVKFSATLGSTDQGFQPISWGYRYIVEREDL